MSNKLFPGRFAEIYPHQKNLSAKDYVETWLSDDDVDSVGRAQGTADNCSRLLAKLIQTLFDKGHLSKQEIYMMIQGYLPRWEFSEADEDGSDLL